MQTIFDKILFRQFEVIFEVNQLILLLLVNTEIIANTIQKIVNKYK